MPFSSPTPRDPVGNRGKERRERGLPPRGTGGLTALCGKRLGTPDAGRRGKPVSLTTQPPKATQPPRIPRWSGPPSGLRTRNAGSAET